MLRTALSPLMSAAMTLVFVTISHSYSLSVPPLLANAKVIYALQVEPEKEIYCYHFLLDRRQMVLHDSRQGNLLLDLSTHQVKPKSQWSVKTAVKVDRAVSRFTQAAWEKMKQICGMNLFWQEDRRVSFEGIALDIPRDVLVRDVDVSRHGDRAAWLLTSVKTSPVEGNEKSHSEEITALWISQKNSSKLREIGELERLSDRNTMDDFRYIAWMPDGRQVYLNFSNTLYAVSVP